MIIETVRPDGSCMSHALTRLRYSLYRVLYSKRKLLLCSRSPAWRKGRLQNASSGKKEVMRRMTKWEVCGTHAWLATLPANKRLMLLVSSQVDRAFAIRSAASNAEFAAWNSGGGKESSFTGTGDLVIAKLPTVTDFTKLIHSYPKTVPVTLEVRWPQCKGSAPNGKIFCKLR